MRGVECACRAYNLVIQVRTSKATTTNKKASKNCTPKKSITNITTCLCGVITIYYTNNNKYIGVFRYFSKTLYKRNGGDLFDAIDMFFNDPDAVNLVEEKS